MNLLPMNPMASRLSIALATAWLAAFPTMNAKEPGATSTPPATAESNKKLVRDAFDRWRAGTGSPFELLAAEATWTLTGSSEASKKYPTREAFMDGLITPFNARVSKPLVPAIRGVFAEGDTVIALFDAETVAKDGKPYRNTYAWFMRMGDGKILEVTAFLDSRALDDLWRRVPASP